MSAIASIFGFLGSATGGALFGWVGALGNRYFDYLTAKLNLERERIKGEYDVKLLGLEIEGRTKVAAIEGEYANQEAAMSLQAASYSADRATYQIWLVDAIRGLIRPGITLWLLYLATQLYGAVEDQLPNKMLTNAQVVAIIDWFLFTTGTCVSWWFGTRVGKPK